MIKLSQHGCFHARSLHPSIAALSHLIRILNLILHVCSLNVLNWTERRSTYMPMYTYLEVKYIGNAAGNFRSPDDDDPTRRKSSRFRKSLSEPRVEHSCGRPRPPPSPTPSTFTLVFVENLPSVKDALGEMS